MSNQPLDIEGIEKAREIFCLQCGPEGLCRSCSDLEQNYIIALKAEVEALRARVQELEGNEEKLECWVEFDLSINRPIEVSEKFPEYHRLGYKWIKMAGTIPPPVEPTKGEAIEAIEETQGKDRA